MNFRPINTLLVVEDNAGDARLLREMFAEHGVVDSKFKYVESMLDAEAHLESNAVDIILLDLGLPDASGLEAVRRIRTAASKIPLVVLTGLDDESLALHALQEGAQDYLVKGQIEARGLLRSMRYAIERKYMEEELVVERTRSELDWARHMAIHEATPDLVGISDPEGRLLYVNRGGRRMLGVEESADITGYTVRDFHPPLVADDVAGQKIPIAINEGLWSGETELLSLSGRVIPVSQVILAHKSRDGSLEFLSTTARDITERKQTERTLRLQSAALNAAANAIAITEPGFGIVWINPAFTELTGYSGEAALGRNLQHLLGSGSHGQSFYDDIADTLSLGESWRGEMVNRRSDGSLYPSAQTITPVRDGDGAISHYISFQRDLTAQRLMEAQLRQSQKLEAVGQLAAGVAHEFNNLLQALMSMAAIIRLRSSNAELAAIGTEMEGQIKRGASLTQQLLLFSGRHENVKADLDLREEVRKASALLRRMIPENIAIELEAASERLSVQGDAGHLQQVLLNLAINARDAMPDGGTLTFRSGECGSDVYFEVEDSGVGVDEEIRARIFEPFFSTKELGKGSGLGLAVVHGIITEHSGRIEVRSGAVGGICFRVSLPGTSLEEFVEGERLEEHYVQAGSGRILLVEDEEAVREGITALLEIMGYEVTPVSSGEQALGLPEHPAPSLVLCDVTLTGMSGMALRDALHLRWPPVPFVLMSGHLGDALRSRTGESGWYFLQKPFEMADLASRLDEALLGAKEKVPA